MGEQKIDSTVEDRIQWERNKRKWIDREEKKEYERTER